VQKHVACGVGARLGAFVGDAVGAPVGCSVVGLAAEQPTSFWQSALQALSYVFPEAHVTGW